MQCTSPKKRKVQVEIKEQIQVSVFIFYSTLFFYTLGDNPGLSLKAVIKVPSKMVSSSGSVKDADAETFSFKSLLSQPDFSDVRLKCGEKVFNCHKVLLANK